MKQRPRLRNAFRWSEALLWIVGCSALAYCTYAVIGAKIMQARLSHLLERDRHLQTHGEISAQVNAEESKPHASASNRSGRKELVGRLEIPRIGLSAMVLEGDSAQTMRLGLGHIPGTSNPGQPGNIGIAGHRDTFFRPLRRIDKGDDVIVETAARTYRYRVSSIEIVEPQNIWVLSQENKDELTLITCYPFSYIGAAPKRFVVHAEVQQ